MIPGFGLVAGPLVNAAGDMYERNDDGDENWFWGGIGDATGINTLVSGWGTGDFGEMALGGLEMLGSVVGAGQIVRGGMMLGNLGIQAGAGMLSRVAQFARNHPWLVGTAGAASFAMFGPGTTDTHAGITTRALRQLSRSACSLGRGVWDLGLEARGLILESRRLRQLGPGKLPNGFETFDHFSAMTRTAISVKSLDLLSSTYLRSEAIVSRGRSIVNKIWAFNKADKGGVVLFAKDIRHRGLDLIVPRGATTEQIGALNNLVRYGRGLRVNVRIIVR